MEFEPNIPEPRESEALVIAVDSFTNPNLGSNDSFQLIRDAAMRMARTRLIYSTLKDDLLAVVKSGSDRTNNKLADTTEGGYEGIELLHPPVSKNLAAVRALAELTPGQQPSNLLNLLEVCGDTLSQPAVDRAKKKRLVLFTDGAEIAKSVTSEYLAEFEAVCELYKEHEMRVDVIFYSADHIFERLQELEDELANLGDLSTKEWIQHTDGIDASFLFILSKVTGGNFLSYKDASPLLDRPTPKIKRAMAKYRGTLNIADVLKIPVKRFSFVNEAKPVAGKKISWDSSAKRKKPVPVNVETQKVASAKDDAPLEAGQIVNAYPYGPELVPEQNEVDTYAWSIHLPKGLDVLGFVEQSSVPSTLFLGHVDVVIAMSAVHGADRLMKSLVLALQAESLGILTRSVAAAKGGAPQLAFLWPRVEVCKDSGTLKNFFLFMVDIPMREDVRDLPFATLEDATGEIPEKASFAMNRYISACLFEEAECENDGSDVPDDEEELLWPPDISNPNLDWFNICIVHRALSDVGGTDFPPLSTWHRKVMDPASFLREKNRCNLSEALQELKAYLPVIPAKRKDKKGKRVHEAVNGDLTAILDYLPKDAAGSTEEDDMDSEGNDEGISRSYENYDDALSGVTDFDSVDVGEETPVADFIRLVEQGKFNFAAVSLLVVVRRLIRDVIDDDKAMECLQALRRVSVERKEPRFFNDCISSLVSRCNRRDATGNRTAAFFRYVGKCGQMESTVKIIPISTELFGESESHGDRAHREFLEDISVQVKRVVLEKVSELSTSVVSKK